MLDIESWLKTTGYTVAETSFLRDVDFPYVVFLSHNKKRGGDDSNCIADRSITIELYSDVKNEVAEKAIEALIDSLPSEYEKERIWLGNENMYQTIYDFELTEKITQEEV